jgi:CheY-like chemotaxis protein
LASIKDITERKKIERNLIESKELAQEASLAKTRFLSNMSHEIRTPLNGILGLIHLLKDDSPTPSQNKYLEIMEFSTHHLVTILNEILDYNKIESGNIRLEIRPVKLEELVQNITNLHRPKMLEKNLDFKLIIDPNIPQKLYLDELRNGQILNNLISNAIKFTNEGFISLSITLVEKKNNYALIQFNIIDSGIGIPENKIQYIFNEFTQAYEDHTRKYGGTGLGLPISKKLIELQGGTILVQSRPNIGTSMSYELRFDIVEDNQFSSSVEVKNSEDHSFLGKYVLLVEDNEVNILVAKKYLEKWSLNVDVAMDGIEALELLKKKSYDLILMDFHMPNMDGLTCTKHIRELNISTPIIGLSADVTSDVKDRYLDYLMNGYLSKPFRPMDLKSLLKKFLNKS